MEYKAVSTQEIEAGGQRSADLHGSRVASHVSRRRSRAGFTLVELVLVIILIAILASIAVPRFVNLSRQAEIAATRGALGAIRGAMVMDYASRTLVNRGVAKFSNVIYSSWFFELDTPTNEMTNSSSVNNGINTGAGTAADACPPNTFPLGMTCGENMQGAYIDATDLVARGVAAVAVPTDACNVNAAGTVLTGWYYESFGDFEGVVKPCGDNSAAAGFTDDTADVW